MKINTLQVKLIKLILLFIIGVFITFMTYENILTFNLFSSLFYLFILILIATFFLKIFYQLKYITELVKVRDKLSTYYKEKLHLNSKIALKMSNNLIMKKKRF